MSEVGRSKSAYTAPGDRGHSVLTPCGSAAMGPPVTASSDISRDYLLRSVIYLEFLMWVSSFLSK